MTDPIRVDPINPAFSAEMYQHYIFAFNIS